MTVKDLQQFIERKLAEGLVTPESPISVRVYRRGPRTRARSAPIWSLSASGREGIEVGCYDPREKEQP